MWLTNIHRYRGIPRDSESEQGNERRSSCGVIGRLRPGDTKSIVVYVEHGTRGHSIAPKVGDIVLNHAAAGTKAIIAFSDVLPTESFLEEKLEKFTERTIVDLQVLKKEIVTIRDQGVAFCKEEMEIGLNAIGAPIFNHEGKPVAGLVVVGLIGRVQCDIHSRIVAELKKTAAKLSDELFHCQ